jgi:hypothetical protein
MVATNPTPGRDDEYNDWYTNRHLAEILAMVDGCVAAQRFRVVDPADGPHRYLAFYEFEADSPQAVHAALAKAGPALAMTDALDMASIVLTVAEDMTGLVARGD